MTRRSRNKGKLWGIIAAVVVIVALLAVLFLLMRPSSGSYRTIPAFPVSEYKEGAANIMGNEYKLSSIINNQLAWSETEGRVMSVFTKEGNEVLAVHIPQTFQDMNVQRGQAYQMKIKVLQHGALEVLAMEKE